MKNREKTLSGQRAHLLQVVCLPLSYNLPRHPVFCPPLKLAGPQVCVPDGSHAAEEEHDDGGSCSVDGPGSSCGVPEADNSASGGARGGMKLPHAQGGAGEEDEGGRRAKELLEMLLLQQQAAGGQGRPGAGGGGGGRELGLGGHAARGDAEEEPPAKKASPSQPKPQGQKFGGGDDKATKAAKLDRLSDPLCRPYPTLSSIPYLPEEPTGCASTPAHASPGHHHDHLHASPSSLMPSGARKPTGLAPGDELRAVSFRN